MRPPGKTVTRFDPQTETIRVFGPTHLDGFPTFEHDAPGHGASTQQNGVAVASVGSGVESVGAYEAAGALGKAFESSVAAFVIDLAGRAPSGAGFAEHLGRLAARAKEKGRFLGLVGGSEDLAGQLGGSSEDGPKLYDDLESALAAAAGSHETEGAAEAPSGSPGQESSEE